MADAVDSVATHGAAANSAGGWFENHTQLESDPRVTMGILPNGMRFVLQSNAYPPNRVCAYLEVDAGSLCEQASEQGIAHLLEHCVFTATHAYPDVVQLKDELARLGMSYGGDSNAYTVFRSTVYTLEAPVHLDADSESGIGQEEHRSQRDSGADDHDTDDPDGADDDDSAVDENMPENDDASEADGDDRMDESITEEDAGAIAEAKLASTTIPKLLHILRELVFRATMESPAVDTERTAVVSEASMRNTLDYRVDVAMTSQVHWENACPRRMPIGLVSVVQSCSRAQMLEFYRKWYRPEYMTLYLVGPIPDRDAMVRAIQGTFQPGPISMPAVGVTDTIAAPPRLLGAADLLDPHPNRAIAVTHDFSRPAAVPMMIAQHPLLHAFCFMLTWKVPTSFYETRTRHDFATAVLDIIIGYALEDRISTIRQRCAHPAFSSASWDDSPLPEEECGMRSVVISADVLVNDTDAEATDGDDGFGPYTMPLPVWHATGWIGEKGSKWQRAMTIGFRECLRFVKYGIMEKELRLASQIFVKELQDRVASDTSIDNEEILGELQNGVYLRSAALSPRQEYEYTAELVKEITPERATARIRELMGFVEDVAAESVRLVQAVHDGTRAAEECAAHLFAASSKALSIFVASPGKEDTLSPITSAVASACTSEAAAASAVVAAAMATVTTPSSAAGGPVPVAAEDALLLPAVPLTRTLSSHTAATHATDSDEQAGAEGVASPTLFDRMHRAGNRRALLTRLVSGAGDESDDGASQTGSQTRDVRPEAELPASVAEAAMARIQPIEILAAIAHATLQLAPPTDLDIPDMLISDAALEAKRVAALEVHAAAGIPYGFVDLSIHETDMVDQFSAPALGQMRGGKLGNGAHADVPVPPAAAHRLVDATTGICMMRCSNGMTVTYKPTRFEPNLVSMSVLCRLGRGVEGPSGWTWGQRADGMPSASTLAGTLAAGLTYGAPAFERKPLPLGSTELGVRALMYGGAGEHTADALNRIGTLWGLQMSCSSLSEYMLLNVTVSTSDEGMERAMQLVHLVISEPRWEPTAFARARDTLASDSEHLRRNVDRLADWTMGYQCSGGDPRMHSADFADPSTRIDLATVRAAVEELLVPGNAHVIVVGDFHYEHLETAVLKYLAPLPMPSLRARILDQSLAAYADEKRVVSRLPLLVPPATVASAWVAPWQSVPVVISGKVVRTADAEQRCCMLMILPALGKYAALPDASRYIHDGAPVVAAETGRPNPRHPMFLYRCLNIVMEVANSRLFKALRDDTGWCYSASYAQSAGEYMHPGQGGLTATPLPEHAPQALAAACRVIHETLSGIKPITLQEFKQAHAPLVQEVRTSFRTSSYWHAIAMHVNALNSMKRIRFLHGIMDFYENLTLEDILEAVPTLFSMLPSPLPIHVTVGISGTAPFVAAPDGGAELAPELAWERLVALSQSEGGAATAGVVPPL